MSNLDEYKKILNTNRAINKFNNEVVRPANKITRQELEQINQSLNEMKLFQMEEKQDRIKSDRKQCKITWIGNGLMFLTLIVALVALFK